LKKLFPTVGEHPGWDARQTGRPQGGMAVAVGPGKERIERVQQGIPDLLADETTVRPARWTPPWRESLSGGIAHLLAAQQLPGAWFPALSVPRFVHGQSQGICDLFGARVELREDGNYFAHPLRPEPAAIDAIEPRPLDTSIYWGAVEWLTYARAATGGRFAFRNSVMTGPFDTVNYLLGTTVLMEWVYTEPAVVHRLLDKVTEVIIAMLGVLQKAAGGVLHGDALGCMCNAYCLCSECRSLVSVGIYEEFEAPCLARIGQRCGPYGIHSCGSWERTVPVARRDPNLRAMNGHVRENDLALLCELARGDIVLSIGRSQNVHDRHTWPDLRSFLSHVLRTTPADQPLEITLAEEDLELWHELSADIHCTGDPPAPSVS